MNRNVSSTAVTILLAMLAMIMTSSVQAADIRQVWLANSPILLVQNDAGGYTVAQRVNDLQLRANDLLPFGKNTPTFTFMKSGMDTNIYADKEFLMTVTREDARANGTTSAKLARIYAKRFSGVIPGVISLYQPSGVKLNHVNVPRNTVIRVNLDSSLSSANCKVGDNFYAYQEDMSSGFPKYTKFTGRIESVTKASGNKAGQIGVSFVNAKLLDGTRLPLKGQLISLDDRSVMIDPASGRLIGTMRARNPNSKFVASGAGAGLAIGHTIGNRPFMGAVLGADAGNQYDHRQISPAIGKDVRISSGTGIGIRLSQGIILADTSSAAMNGAITDK